MSSLPTTRLSEYDIRLAKRQQLIDMGIQPYTQSFDKKNMIADLVGYAESNLRSIEDILSAPRSLYSTAGRLMLKRVSGKLAFGKIQDESGEIQVMWEYQTSKLINLPNFKNTEEFVYFSTDDIPSDELEAIKQKIDDKYIIQNLDGKEDQLYISCTGNFFEVQELFHKKYVYGFVNKTGGGFYDKEGTFHKNGGSMPEQQISTHTQENSPRVNLTLPENIQKYSYIDAYIKTKNTIYTSYYILDKFLDIGDIIGVHGELFVTHKGELTLFVSAFQLLSKALRPLGDKRHGIGEDNQEKAYRQRYLDMIFNRETMERMKFRSNFIRTLREFYWKHNFLEIDCPVLTPAASGAAAQPFVTHHNDFDKDFYLRICNETELKKATVGGLEKVFTIATNFRNEGSDPSHLQEFTMLEHQNVYRSFHEDMDFTQAMFEYIFETLQIPRIFTVKDKNGNPREVNFSHKREKIDYVEGVNAASGLQITSYGIDDADKLRADIRAKGIEFEGMETMGTMTLIDYLYKKVLRPTITGPAFIYNYPSIIAPLARISDTDPRKCEKRQVVVNGWEIINSYGELVDPVRQQENFIEQSKAESGGDNEATSADDDFVKAMEYGMPIQALFGMGIDRIIALLTQQDNLRDVVMFPLMKPENGTIVTSRDSNIYQKIIFFDTNILMHSQGEKSEDILTLHKKNKKIYDTHTSYLLPWVVEELRSKNIDIHKGLGEIVTLHSIDDTEREMNKFMEDLYLYRDDVYSITIDLVDVLSLKSELLFEQLEKDQELLSRCKKILVTIYKSLILLKDYDNDNCRLSAIELLLKKLEIEDIDIENPIGEIIEKSPFGKKPRNEFFTYTDANRLNFLFDYKNYPSCLNSTKQKKSKLKEGSSKYVRASKDSLIAQQIILYSKILSIGSETDKLFFISSDIGFFRELKLFFNDIQNNELLNTAMYADLSDNFKKQARLLTNILDVIFLDYNKLSFTRDEQNYFEILDVKITNTATQTSTHVKLQPTTPNEIIPTISLESATTLATTYLTSTLLHCQQVAHCMKYFAQKNGLSDTVCIYRYIVGLLHDVDWDEIDKDPALHTGDKLEEILGEICPSCKEGVEGDQTNDTGSSPTLLSKEGDQLLADIRSHYPDKRAEPQYALNTNLRKYLISIDELSGLMYAYARMRGGSFDGMETSGVIKKIKDTKFAAGVDRSHVRHCETQLDIPLEDFVGQMIEAMQGF